MSQNVTVSSSGALNYFHILTLIFVVAKLANVIDWSWWFVFMPSIVSIGIGVTILAIVGIIAAVVVFKK